MPHTNQSKILNICKSLPESLADAGFSAGSRAAGGPAALAAASSFLKSGKDTEVA